MTNHHLINAVLQLECAIEATFEPVERKELEEIALNLRRRLQKRGIFLGSLAHQTKEDS